MQAAATDKKLKRAADLTKQEVLEIWTMRAGRKTNKEIAKKIGCHIWVSSDVVVHGAGPSVPIPADIKKAALQTVIPRPRTGGYKRKSSKDLPPLSLDTVLPAFVQACMQLEKAHDDCIAVGVPEDTLQLMAMSLKEKLVAKPK